MMLLNVDTHPPARSPVPTGAARQPGAPQCSPLPANCQSEPGDTEQWSDNAGEGETHLDILPCPRDHLSKQLGVVSVQGRLASLAPFMKHEAHFNLHNYLKSSPDKGEGCEVCWRMPMLLQRLSAC